MPKPNPGDIVNGYRFNGGDPSDQNAWAPASPSPSTGKPNPGDVVNGFSYKGGDPKDKANWQENKPDIVQEMHPDIQTKLMGMQMPFSVDRWGVKNFSANPQETIGYLKREHPDLDIQNYKGQIIMKRPEEKQYRVLDPDTGIHPLSDPKELLNDAGDIAYDVASGIPVQAATAAGGALGFASPVPGGAMMGAMGAGAAANAGNEYLRQKIGKLLGINQGDTDTSNLKVAGAIGAASPLLLGVDKVPGFVPGAEGLLNATAKEGFKDASRGLLNRGLVGTASLATGIPSQELRDGFNRLTTIKHLEDAGVSGFAEETQKNIKDTLDQSRETSWQKIQNTLDKANVNIDLSNARQKMEDLLAKYKGSDVDNPIMKGKIAEVENTISNVFGKDIPPSAQQVSTGLLDEFGNPIVKTIVDPGKKATSALSAKGAYELQQQLGEIADLNNSSFLSKLTGKDAADRELALAAKSAQKEINSSLDQAISTDALKKEYAQAATIQKSIAPKFSTPDATFNTLRNLGGKNKKVLMEQLGNMDAHYGTDVLEKAKDLQAWNRFSNASTDAISSGGSTSTSRTIPMAIGGWTIGHQLGGYPGAMAGGFLGSKLASPAAVRMGMEALTPMVKGAQYVPAAAKNSVWNLMMNQKKDE